MALLIGLGLLALFFHWRESARRDRVAQAEADDAYDNVLEARGFGRGVSDWDMARDDAALAEAGTAYLREYARIRWGR
jgi:hypothetical protein